MYKAVVVLKGGKDFPLMNCSSEAIQKIGYVHDFISGTEISEKLFEKDCPSSIETISLFYPLENGVFITVN